ncbi:MAG TPA: hypothetical protein VJY39_23820 [Acidisphaera sp.]|nr:hypothetical protein [Acidisphaera sp.]
MMPAAVLAALRAAGVRVAAVNGGGLSLVPTPPAGLLAEARAHKAALLALLAAGPDVASDTPPAPGLIERLAAALMAPRPWQWMTDPERAAIYFRAEARRRLALMTDDTARVEAVELVERRVLRG